MWRGNLWTVPCILALGAVFSPVNAGVGAPRGRDLQTIPDQAVRRWTDAAGERRAAARLLAADEQAVRLEKPDGKVVTVALESLSPADRQFIRSQRDVADAMEGIKIAGASLTKLIGGPTLASVPGLVDRLSAPIPPNAIYLRISQPFLNRYIKHRVFKRAPVNDCILGTPVQGTSQTTGRTDLTLVPDTQRARIDLRLTGTADATTVAAHDPVSIYTRSWTGFHSAKHIVVDEKGISQSPARTQAQTQSTTTGISTCLGPILERIVLRIAWRRVNESRAATDSVSASHTARRVDREVDQAVDDAVVRIRTAMTLLHNVMRDHKIKRPRMLSSTTGDYLQIVLLRDDADERDTASFVAAPAADSTRPDIELTIHSAVVIAALKDSGVRNSFQPVLNTPWYQSLLKFSTVALWSKGKQPLPDYEVRWSDGGEWLRLEWNARRGTGKDTVADANRK